MWLRVSGLTLGFRFRVSGSASGFRIQGASSAGESARDFGVQEYLSVGQTITYLSIYLCMYLHMYLSTFLSIALSIYLSSFREYLSVGQMKSKASSLSTRQLMQ